MTSPTHLLCCAAVALLVLYPLVPESPHWLAVSGDAAGADAVLRRVAAVNGAQLPPGRLEGPAGLSATSAASEVVVPYPACLSCDSKRRQSCHWMPHTSAMPGSTFALCSRPPSDLRSE